MRLKGIAVSPGIAIGTLQQVYPEDIHVARTAVPADGREAEVERLKAAVDETLLDIGRQKEVARTRFSEDFLAIFDAYAFILKDPALLKGADEIIRKRGVNAEWALQQSVRNMLNTLHATEDPYFQERATDLEDLHRRIQQHMAGPLPQRLSWSGQDLVIVAKTLTPSETSALNEAPVIAFATERGARTSHTAIIARSLNIPAVVGVKSLMETAASGEPIIVDGLEGVVVLNPGEEELADYRARGEAYARQRELILSSAKPEARTVDGHRILVSANIDLVDDVEAALSAGANGCGLYRSEFLYLETAPELPTEDRHVELYDKLGEAFYPQRVVIRTLDLGGEKYFHNVLDKTERNPVLGVRAIRFCLAHEALFKTQLRGILRASHRKNVSILLPMVTTVDEMRQAKTLLEVCKGELRAEGLPFDESIPVGVMVEVPACALSAPAFAPYVDFFSIGTNDLIQYLLAIDRNNDAVAHLYNPLHPAVLRCIASVCEAADTAGKPVSVCGEAASDPAFIPLLLGMGVEELSMVPASILEQKERIRHLSLRGCRKLARKTAKALTVREVAELVEAFQ